MTVSELLEARSVFPTARPILVDPEDRDAWLAARRRGIGSSDAPSIVGLDPFRSPFAVWADKVHGSQQDDNDAMRWGRRLEAAVAAEYADEHGVELWKPSIMWGRDGHVATANPDRVICSGDAPFPILEIKTSRLEDEWSDDEPPIRVRVQVQHQLGVTGAPWADVAVLLHGRTYREFRIERDEAAIEWLLDYEARWWARYVVGGEPPEVDGHRSTTDALRDLYAAVDADQVVDVDDEAAAVFAELERTREVERAAKARAQDLRNRLVAKLGPAGVGRYDGVDLFVAKPYDRTDLDEKAIAAERPRLHAALRARYGRTTQVRTVRRAPKPKGDKR